jgi:uncharacterized protein (DUF58 family)
MPTVEEYLRPDVLAQVARFDLKAKFLIEGFLAGLHRSPFKGFSTEFSDYRRYTPGDDPKTIDWKVFARTNRYFVKRYEAETNLECHLVVDATASMGYGTRSVTKLEYATCMAAALAYLMVTQQDAVGLITLGAAIRDVVPPRSKRVHVFRLLQTLSTLRAAGQADLAAHLHAVAALIPKRSLVVVLSDLLAEPGPVLDAFHHLRFRGHELVVFHILDAAEAAFPFSQLTRFEDLETDQHLTADARVLRTAYLRELEAFIEGYRSDCLRHRIDYMQVDTSTTFDKALLAYLVRRAGYG